MVFKYPRGPETRIPLLGNGQAVWAKDTGKLIIGGPSGNVEMAKKTDVTAKADKSYVDSELSSVNSSLAQTSTKSTIRNTFDNIGVQRGKYADEPIITFIDDDGSYRVLDRLKPVSLAKGVPWTIATICKQSAIITDLIKRAELLDMVENHGWTIESHLPNHQYLVQGNYTVDQLHAIFQEDLQFYAENGIEVESVVYPGGERNNTILDVVKQYYKSGVAIEDFLGGNTDTTNPMRLYELTRTGFGVYSPHGDYSLDFYKSEVDACIAKKSWLIFMTHCGEHSEAQQVILGQLIDYIKSKGVKVLNHKEALRIKGHNINLDNRHINGDHFILRKNGVPYSNSINSYKDKNPNSTIDHLTDISGFKIGITTIKEFALTGGTHSFPISRAGTLETYKSEVDNNASYQKWYPYNSEETYTRKWNNGAWTAWTKFLTGKDVNLRILALNSFSESNLMADYTFGITSFPVNGTAGFFGGKIGTVTTYKLYTSGWDYQIFEAYNGTPYSFKRVTKTDGSWSKWTPQGTPHFENFYTATSDVNAFPSDIVVTCAISGANTTGFPDAATGVIETYFNGNDPSINYQRFYKKSSNDMYKRYYNLATGWTAWVKFTGV